MTKKAFWVRAFFVVNKGPVLFSRIIYADNPDNAMDIAVELNSNPADDVEIIDFEAKEIGRWEASKGVLYVL